MLPDDQKRLQVVNSVNPSLRQAATPASFLQGGANPQQSFNPQPTYSPQQTVNYNTPQNYNVPQNLSVSVAPTQNLYANNQVYGPSLNLRAPVMQDKPLSFADRFDPRIIGSGANSSSPYAYVKSVPIGKQIIGFGEGLGRPFGYLGRTDIINPAQQIFAQATGNKNLYNQAEASQNQLLTPQQLIGNSAQALLTVGAPGIDKGIESGVGKLLPEAVPGVASRVIGKTAAGTALGVGFNESALAGSGEKLTKKNVKSAAKSGALVGGGLALGGSLVGEGLGHLGNNNVLSNAESKSFARSTNTEAIQNSLSNKLGVSPESVADLAQNIADASSKRDVNALVNQHITNTLAIRQAEAALTDSLSQANTPQQTQDILEQHYPGLREKLGEQNMNSLVDTLSKTKDPGAITEIIKHVDGLVEGHNAAGLNTIPPEAAPAEAPGQSAPIGAPENLDTPSFMRGSPSTVGEAATQYNMGIDNLDRSVLNADSRATDTSVLAHEPLDDPAYIRKDPVAAAQSAREHIAQIDAQMRNIGNPEVAKFNAKQELANNLKNNPAGREAIIANYQRRIAAYDAGDVQAITNQLLVDRNHYTEVLRVAESATGDPAANQLAQEQIASQSLRNQAAPQATPGEASTTSVENKSTGVTDQVNANADTSAYKDLTSKEPLRRKAMSLEYRANKIGETGQELTRMVATKRGDLSQAGTILTDKAQPFLDLSKEEQAQAVDVKEGKATTDNPRVQAGVNALNDMYTAEKQLAEANGVQHGDLGDTYFNHTYPKGYFDKPENFNTAVKHLVDSGQAQTTEDAVKMMTQFKKTGFGSPEFGNFKTREADVPGYLKNGDAVRQYIHGASERIADVANFGDKGEKLNQLIGQAVEKGEDAGALRDIIDSYRNREATGATPLGKLAKGYQKTLNVLQLPKAAISHVPQLFTNTGSDIGFANTLKATAETVFDPETKQFLHDAGFDYKRPESGGLANKVTSPGLKQLVDFYRKVSGAGGANIAEGLAKNGDVEGLSKIGVSGPLEAGADGSISLTPEQKIQAAHFVADKNIGAEDPFQSPAWTQGDLGKFVSQYKRAYVFKQGERILGMFNEAKSGNVAPLAKYLLVAPLAGATVALAKSEIKNPGSNPIAEVKKNPGGFALDSLHNSGLTTPGFGEPQNAIDAVRYNYGTDSRYANAAGAVAPGLGTAVQTGQAIDKAVRGNSRPLKSEALGFAPVGSGTLKKALLPPSTFNDATDAEKVVNGVTIPKGVKVNVPKNATPLQTQALVDKAAGNFKTKDVLNSYSKEDQALIGLSDEKLQEYVDNKQIDQAKFDQIMGEKQAVNNATSNSYSRTGDPAADAYYKHVSGLDKKGLNSYLNAPPDAAAKAIASQFNKNMPDGLQPIQANNRVLKEYADYRKTIADAAKKGQPLDQFQQRTADRNLWAKVATESLPDNVASLYKVSSTQLQDYFIHNKKVSMADVQQAINFDDALLKADLIDSPHFSKSFRKAFGFGAASEVGIGTATSSSSGGSRGGGKSGKGSTNPASPNYNGYSSGINQLLPPNLSIKQPTISTVPSFSPISSHIPKVNYFKPTNVTGEPLPGRATSLRVKRVTIQ